MIILQLKSTQRKADLESISNVIRTIENTRSYKIKGHEIQQLATVMNDKSMKERGQLVIDFCTKNEIEYLTYHSPIFLNGENIWDERWKREIANSILLTAEEVEMVHSKAGFSNKVIVIVHLTNYAPIAELPLTAKERNRMFEDTAREFLELFQEHLSQRKYCEIAVENAPPVSHGAYKIVGPFHPLEISQFENYGIGAVLDFAHYSMFSKYLQSGREIYWGDADSETEDLHKTAPDWSEAIRILSKSLVQLHINDAKGSDTAGEGLPLGEGEIPIVDILETIASTIRRTIRGTIEIKNGHLNSNRLQLEAAHWLLSRISTGVFE